MDIKTEISWIQKELQEIKDPAFIEAIKNMLKYRKKASSKRISIEQYNEEINKSIAQIKEGKFYTHQEMGERIKQWSKQ